MPSPVAATYGRYTGACPRLQLGHGTRAPPFVSRTQAKRVCRLDVETVRMAKELGLSPRVLMKNVASKSQPWKAPVHVWVRDMYAARQAKIARKRAGQCYPSVGTEEHGAEAGPPNRGELTIDFLDEVPF
jgi:hypothetical protein